MGIARVSGSAGHHGPRGDERVVFLDFGMAKTVAWRRIELELAVIRAALEHDAHAVHDGLAALGFFELDDPRFDLALVLEHVRAINAWYADGTPVTLNPEYVSRLLAHARDPRSKYWGPDEQRDDPRGITAGKPDARHDPVRDRPTQRHRELASHDVRVDLRIATRHPLGRAEARFSERRAPRRAPRRDESALARAHDQLELGAP